MWICVRFLTRAELTISISPLHSSHTHLNLSSNWFDRNREQAAKKSRRNWRSLDTVELLMPMLLFHFKLYEMLMDSKSFFFRLKRKKERKWFCSVKNTSDEKSDKLDLSGFSSQWLLFVFGFQFLNYRCFQSQSHKEMVWNWTHFLE